MAAGDIGRYGCSFAAGLSLPESWNRLIHPLQEVAQVLASSSRIKSGMNRTLEILAACREVTRSAIVLCRPRASDLHVEASYGLTPEDQMALPRVENGITEQVLGSGKPVVVHKANEQFSSSGSNSTRTIQLFGGTFAGIPIVLSRQTYGILLLDITHQKNRDYDLTLAFANLIASMRFKGSKLTGCRERGQLTTIRRACSGSP